MCGIVGYIGPQDATTVILEGLSRLEYRGYDSAGVAIVQDGQIAVRRDAGKLKNLIDLVEQEPISGNLGIGHTRWATHGEPNQRNAHPHMGMSGEVAVVHNGIVENFAALREELTAEGAVFKSDTDSEVIVHLVERYLNADGTGDLPEAFRKALGHLKGAQAVGVVSAKHPGLFVVARIGNAGGVTVGIGEGEMFIASDMPAILEHTRRMVFLESRQMAIVTQEGYEVRTLDGEPVKAEEHTVAWDPVSAAKGEYKHFMQKEIFEQPRALADAIGGRVNLESGQVSLDSLNLTAERAQALSKVVIVACGTSYYSGLVGKALIEKIARVPVEVAIGSEFRYADPILDDSMAVLAITQSGETVDTLAAMEEARNKGALLWAIVNAIGSQAMRIADGFIGMQAGPEIGVASTKAFTNSIVCQYMLAMKLAELRGTRSPAELKTYAEDLTRLPDLVGRLLDRDDEIKALAAELYRYENFLFLGRGINYPIALEGALKLKEISYIHAEGYPAGEMKHGPIALIDENMPVLVIAVQDEVYDKMLSQVEQANARGGVVVALATEGDQMITSKASHLLTVPPMPSHISPVLNVVPLQLLAYHIAVWRGADVDQPRNLAKSVTVE